METQAQAREAREHPALDWTARVGLIAYGLVYLVLGWLAAQLALGSSDGQVSKDGALHQLADQPLGATVLWGAALGLAALAVWELIGAFVGHRLQRGWRRWAGRIASLTKAGVFAVLAVSAGRVALGDGGSGGTDGPTARLMSMPFGPVLVGLVGAGILAYAAASVYAGLSEQWRDDLDHDGQHGGVGTALTVFAYVGYCARGLAFALVGLLFVWAALTHDPRRSGGLDQALLEAKQAPYGPVALLAVAVGLACYGAFNLGRAKHLSNQ